MDRLQVMILEEKLEKEKELMNDYGRQYREFVDEYGYEKANCDYCKYRREMELFHRGRVNLLMDLMKEL